VHLVLVLVLSAPGPTIPMGGPQRGQHVETGAAHPGFPARRAAEVVGWTESIGYQSAAKEPRAGAIAHTPPGANAIGHEAASLFSLFNVQPGQRPTQAGQRPQAGQLGTMQSGTAMQSDAMQPIVPAAAMPTSSQSVASLLARIQCAQNPRGCSPPPPAPHVPPPPHPPYHPHRPRNCAEYCDSSTCHNSAYSECLGCGPAQGCSSPPPKPPPRPPNPPPPSPVPPEPPPPPPPSPPSPPLPPHPVSLTEMRDIFMQELQQQKAKAKASKVAAKAAKHPPPSSPPPSTPPPSMFGSVLTSWPVLLVLSAVGNALLFALYWGGASGEPRDWRSQQEARVSRGADALGVRRKPLQGEQSRRRVTMRAIKVSQTDDDDCYADDGGQDNGGMDKDDLDEDDLSQEDADEDAEDVDERDEEEACTEAPNLAPARMGRRESSRASWISKAVAPAPALAPHPHHQHTHFDDTRIEASGDTDAAPSADSGCIQRGRGGMHVTTAISHEGSLHHNAMSKQNPPCASCLACAPSASVESEPCIEPAHATAHEPAHEPPNARDERVPDTADAVGSGSKDGRAQELTPLAPAPAAPPSANDGARPRAGGVDCSPKSTPGKGGGRSGRYDAGRGGAGCASLRRPQSTVPTCRCSCSTSLHGEAL